MVLEKNGVGMELGRSDWGRIKVARLHVTQPDLRCLSASHQVSMAANVTSSIFGVFLLLVWVSLG